MSRSINTLKAMLNKMAPAAKLTKLGDVINDLITAVNSLCFGVITAATLCIKAGGSAVVKSSTAIICRVNGLTVTKTADTDMAALVGTLATLKYAAWAFYVDSAGTMTTSAKTADSTSSAAAIALLPAVPAGKLQVGYIVVYNGTAADFVGGTTALDAALLVVTYVNTPVSPLYDNTFTTAMPIANLSER
jgi:hypothetical protein